MPVDAHLMIEDPDTIAPRYAQAGCTSVSFHFEAAKNCRQTIADIKSNGAKVGIAIKPATPLSAIEEFLDEIDMLVVLFSNKSEVVMQGFKSSSCFGQSRVA